jgi:hypothetical protein
VSDSRSSSSSSSSSGTIITTTAAAEKRVVAVAGEGRGGRRCGVGEEREEGKEEPVLEGSRVWVIYLAQPTHLFYLLRFYNTKNRERQQQECLVTSKK